MEKKLLLVFQVFLMHLLYLYLVVGLGNFFEIAVLGFGTLRRGNPHVSVPLYIYVVVTLSTFP